jgi:ABC-type glycerol-3-phosphate transport system substrate-binding protein
MLSFSRKFVSRMLLGFCCAVVVLSIAPVRSAAAQSDSITLTVSVPDWMMGGMTDGVFEPFEEAHPGVDVIYVPIGEFEYISSPAFSGLDEHLQAVKDYAAKADVMYVQQLHEVRVESTRAGYWLDLQPLITTDPNFDANDFYPATLESYHWEGGTWALPAKTLPYLLYYDRDAFDAAGVDYPKNDWTLEDFAAAARALAQTNVDGSVQPAFASWDDLLFIRSLMGASLYEPGAIEYLPNFASPELEYVLQTWAELYDEGVVSSFSSMLSPQDVPMFVDRVWTLYNTQERNLGAVLMPNTTALMDISAFAVSGGTQHPELAYALAEYLTRTPEVISYILGDMPARLSVVGVEVEGGIVGLTGSPEQQALVEEAVVNGIPAGELNYRDYLSPVIGQIIRGEFEGDLTPQLEAAAAAMQEIYAAASTHGETNNFAVNAPPQGAVLAEREIALTLGVSMNISPLPNQEAWQAFIEEFVSADAEVGAVELFTPWQATMQTFFDNSDCVVSSSALIPSLDASTALSLTPLLEADPDFDEADYLNGVLSMVQRDDMVWGLPLAAYTEMLWYRTQVFEELGLELPADGWTSAQFGEAVTALREANPDLAVIVPARGNSTYLLMLMAAYGALPLDYRTQPPTVNLTDPAVMAGIQQVLDLAREGIIEYQELDSDSAGGIFSGLGTGPILTATMDDYGFTIPLNVLGDIGDYQLTVYPAGTDYTPVAFRIQAGYISATTPHTESCYRLLKALSERPDLFNGLPVRQIESVPMLTMDEGDQDVSALYNALAAMLNQPNIVLIGQDTRFMSYQETIWLRQAFDAYVLEEADLETVLEDTQHKITEYRACTASLPEFQSGLNTTAQDFIEAQRPYLECAAQVDPERQ